MFNISELEKRMAATVDVLVREFADLRTGRASAGMFDHITADVYGSKTPINQLANVSVVDYKSLLIQVWDKGTIKAIETAIQNSNLGVSTQLEGTSIRVIVPALTEERRVELCKVAGKYAEKARIAIRNIRRDGMDELKKSEKAKEISEDDLKKDSAEVQKLTDNFIKKIDALSDTKEKDILKV